MFAPRLILLPLFAIFFAAPLAAGELSIQEDEKQINIETPKLKAAVRKEGYVSGVAGGSLLDKQTGARDKGFGLDIIDWIMEPGSDAAYRDQLPDHMVYHFGNAVHGQQPKRSIEGPQICTKAGSDLEHQLVQGEDFVAVQNSYHYTLAAPGHVPGSKWTQWLVFPADTRYFVSSDRIDAVNSSDAMFLRLDMPGHIKHKNGDTFSEVYLSYLGGPKGVRIPAKEFAANFAPDERFNYRRDKNGVPKRFIRGYKIRQADGSDGPWLLGLTLDPSIVHEAWCHQRGYICMIQEFGGRPVQAGESFSAAFIVGYFDSIEEANAVYDRYRGATGLTVTEAGWKLTP